ncbi:DMT family transporter [Shimia abyssi]|uniref:EamA-like transporter family protein n=1 Tax=Shimia abyssi TaxID=1662395 RepID=A0A2P8FKQ5_9RHOB|nr:DMT family transporter [Shimia abyssi]PSL22279.1 EamA-like transporter family protein [Shimia abyssi]
MTETSRGHLAMLAFSALVAGSFSLGSLSANEIDPAAFNAVRFLLAAVLIGFAAWFGKGVPRSTLTAPWRYLILGGLFATYFVLMFEGLKTAAPVSTAAVFTLTPLMSAGFGFALLRQITTRRMWLALAIGAIGALWVIFRADFEAFLQFRVGQGEIYYFFGCIAHALYTPMVRKLNRGETPLVFTLGTLIAGFVLLTGYAWSDLRAVDWVALPSIVWIALVYVAVFATAGSFVLLQSAALRLPSAKVMAYTYLVPSWVAVWEIALGNGVPNVLVLGGVALTIVALLLLLRDEH